MAHRPNILKLATKISLESMTYTGITYNDPEYKILEPIIDDDMCQIMMHMRLEANRTVEDIAKRAKKSVHHTQEQLDKLCKTGAVRERVRNGKTYYFYPIWVPGIMEGIMANREQCDKYPVLGECFEEYTRRRVSMLAPFMDAGMNMMRVIPVQAAIENNSRKASYDEVHRLVENAWAISVGACSCRRSRRLMGEGCGHLEDDMCIYLNDNAINYSKIGEHRLIDKEEAYEILKRAERNGLVHELNVSPGYEDATAICNCCGCSCYALRIATYFRAPDAVKSNYVARVDKDKCVACGQCVENCQVNAMKLGSKLCTAETTIPRPTETARNTLLWGGKNYNPDFRMNRTNVTESGTAPCKAACPAHVSVQGYVALAKQGRYLEALQLIKKHNPFPAICGRICNKPCEAACMRGEVDSAVAIDDLKKFIAEQDLNAEQRWIPPMENPRGIPFAEPIAVIGAGPAGLSCAYYLREKGYPVTVFEKEKVLGGMPALAIPSFRLEKDVLNAEIDVLRQMGVEFKTGVEVGRDVTLDALRAQGFKAFFLGVGAGRSGTINVPGADGKTVCFALDMLKKVNLGHNPKLGDDIVIISGGISTNFITLDAARTAAALGAKHVTVIAPRKIGTFSNVKSGVEAAQANGVEFVCEAEVTAISAKDVAYTQAGEAKKVKASAVVIAMDRTVDLGGIGLGLSEKGLVAVNGESMQTAVADVFAGGDVVTGPRYAINAIAAGREAALSIHRYVHEGQDLVLGRDHMDYKGLNRKTAVINPQAYSPAERQVAERKTAKGKNAAWRDTRGVLTPEQAKTEASRCLGCGVAMVDEYMCVGCAICTTHCKFGAIRMEKISDEGNLEYFHTLGRIATNLPNKLSSVAVKHIGRIGK
ncbi:MAG: FAD-dependent oxidoreductase [Oscillospiraceae bacterium]|nr:FAD-dependent oxidoreductase [Oscillospiraceae bacterium]